MILTRRDRIADFCDKNPDARHACQVWMDAIQIEEFQTPQEVTQRFPKASGRPGDKIIFRFRSGYRLIAEFHFKSKIVKVVNLYTHDEYVRLKL